jgi:hypothetical protein
MVADFGIALALSGAWLPRCERKADPLYAHIERDTLYWHRKEHVALGAEPGNSSVLNIGHPDRVPNETHTYWPCELSRTLAFSSKSTHSFSHFVEYSYLSRLAIEYKDLALVGGLN